MKILGQSSPEHQGHLGMTSRLSARVGCSRSDCLSTAFAVLQRRLVQDKLRAVEDFKHSVQIRRANEDASALSWTTGYPLLTYPQLFEEKSSLAIKQATHQEEVYRRSRDLLRLRQ